MIPILANSSIRKKRILSILAIVTFIIALFSLFSPISNIISNIFSVILLVLSALWLNHWAWVWISLFSLLITLSNWLHLSHSSFIMFHIAIIFSLVLILYRSQTHENERQLRQIQTMRVLLQQEPPLSQTVDFSREAVLILDKNGQIMEMNDNVLKLLGVNSSSWRCQSANDLLGLSCIDFLNCTPQRGDFVWNSSYGIPKDIHYSMRPLVDEGVIRGTLLILSDISEEKRKNEAYLQAAKFSVIGQIAGGLAHELRNPLTTIKGFMQLITPEQWPESFRPYHQLILDEIQTTDQIINHFLLLTNPTAPHLEKVIMEEIIQSAIQILQPACLMREVTLMAKIPGSYLLILGDKEQLLQAILSIMQNAIEASPPGEQVLISLEKLNGQIEIIIEDHGPGIPENLRDRVFDPFFTTRKEGTGLGLTIAQQIVTAHHGKLTLPDPEIGKKGTKVTLYLPIFFTEPSA